MKATTNDPLLIIDGNHLAHRVRHVFSLSNRGVDVSVTYGFTKTLISYIRKFHPYAVLVCWDGGVPEFRRQAVPSYKANRHKDEDELAWEDFHRQLDELQCYILPLMGIASIRMERVEADDLIYHATRISGRYNIVITGDKDLLQVITKRTKVYSPSKDKLYGAKELEAEYGVPVANYVHWRAIQGDSSDNIPGVPGIGDKTATKLFKEYGDLVAITNAAAGINPRGTLNGKLGHSINAFGLDRIALNVKVMALYKDRLGCRLGLLRALRDYHPTNVKLTKRYLMSNNFTSLFDALGELSRLSRPVYSARARYPVVDKPRRAYAYV